MLDTLSPIGTDLDIPETLAEDKPYFSASDLQHDMGAARAYYDEHGYVVVRGLISPDLCDHVRAVFDAGVRHTPIPVLRQKNMRYERNEIDSDGFLKNPMFNIQDLGSRALDGFRRAVLDIIAHKSTQSVTAGLLGSERTKVIQSMFFEAPAGTWAHQDSYYQDSAAGLGGATAGWYALEDIDAGAGRFYVCPGSHKGMSPVLNAGTNNFATGHATYQQAIADTVRANGLKLVAPYLAKGDALFWSSLTVHGSLPAGRPGVSRASLTAHYLREQDDMLQFHTRIRPQKTMTYNGMTIGLLHDQDVLLNRVVRDIAFHFPNAYMAARKLALKAVLAKRSLQDSLAARPATATP